ncbi:MAG: MFS transporter [Clostridia bacterium]|nr:MFS transporter [Clostridia bacterium]
MNSSFLHKLFGTTPGKGVQPGEAIAYSVAGFGQNFICTIIGSYITVFMTDALLFGAEGVQIGHISGAVAVAILMLAARVFDAFNDPIMGSVVDKTRTKWGKCRPYLKWMAIPIAISTILCFLPVFSAESVYDGSKTTQTFVTIAVLYVVWSVLYTIADVPYWGLSTCLTNDTTVRGNILTVARMFCTVGAGIVTVFVPMITGAVTAKFKYTVDDIAAIMQDKAEAIANMVANQGITAQEAANTFVGTVIKGQEIANADTLKIVYFICAVVLVVSAIPMFFYGFKNTKERFTSDDNPPSFGHNLKLLFRNKELLLIVLSGVLGGARMVYSYTGGLYFAKYILQNEGLYGVITLLVVPGGLVASLLVPWMSKKFTKKWSYIVVHLFGGVVMAIMYFVGYDAPWKIAICAVGLVLLGIPQGVNNIITYAMIGDTVDYLEWKTGERGEGICFAMQTLINKIGMAVGAFIGVMALSIAQIDTKTYTVGNADALWNVLILSGVISMFACAVPMFFYTITEKRQREMVAEIEARKAKK